jgi:teichuronic acid biosynthesis glycosyltransferase TuaG
MSKEEENLVSIILPVYNGQNYLVKSISSILKQTHQQFEILISDDNSQDNSIKVIKKFKNEKITLLENNDNVGLAKNRKKLLNIAKGRWIAFLDQDDYWEPKKLEKQIKLIQEQNCVMCHTYYQIITPWSKISKIIRSPNKISYDDMLRGNTPGASTVLLDRVKFSDFSKYSDKRLYDPVNDYIIWLEVLRQTTSYSICCSEQLMTYHYDGKNLSRNKFKQLIRHFVVLSQVEKIGYLKCFYFSIINLYNKIKLYSRLK